MATRHPPRKTSRAAQFHRAARLGSPLARPSWVLLCCWALVRTYSSGSRLPAAVSAPASLDSPGHSGSVNHPSARLKPGSSLSLARACPNFSDIFSHSRALIAFPTSPFSNSVDAYSSECRMSSGSAIVPVEDTPSPAISWASCSSGSAAFVPIVRTISPPIPDFPSAALRLSVVADFVRSAAHHLFPLCSFKTPHPPAPFPGFSFPREIPRKVVQRKSGSRLPVRFRIAYECFKLTQCTHNFLQSRLTFF
jgi:hypothetical protein